MAFTTNTLSQLYYQQKLALILTANKNLQFLRVRRQDTHCFYQSANILSRSIRTSACFGEKSNSLPLWKEPPGLDVRLRSSRSKNHAEEGEIQVPTSTLPTSSRLENNDTVAYTPSNIQLISDGLYKQIFVDSPRIRNYNQNQVDKSKNHLETHSLWNQKVPPSPVIDFMLPKLEGNSIDDHFRNIAEGQTTTYKQLLESLCNKIPPMPEEWIRRVGWTKYDKEKGPVLVDYPEEDAFVFDIETCVPNGHLPVMACAVSPKAWYSWCSKSLIDGVDRNPHERIGIQDLIPFETRFNEESIQNRSKLKKKIIVGHNVSFDRARIKEQYFIQETKLRFIDTMSLHIAVSGITSFQRVLKMTMKNGLQALSSDKREELMQAGSLEWNDVSSLNNLKDVHKLYCEGAQEVQKEIRNIFITGNIQEINNDFQNLMTYCANDVKATQEILAKLMPVFYERFPHPVTLAGMLEMGIPYLPINSNWTTYIQKSEEMYSSLETEMKGMLMQKADEALKFLENQMYKHDPWLWDLDWKLPRVRKKKLPTKSKKSQASEKDSLAEIPDSNVLLPAWYRKLFYKPSDTDYIPGPAKISTSMQIIPKLLRLCWFGFPLHHSKTGGWGYLIKRHVINEAKNEEKMDSNENAEECLESDDTPKFPYHEWEIIWEQNKNRLLRRIETSSMNTEIEMVSDDVKCRSEEAVQDIRDFLKGLDSINHLGLRDGKAKKSKTKAQSQKIDHSPHPSCEFRPLPHKDGANYRVGNPLAKDFLNKMEDGILTSESGDVANKLVRLSKMISYWRNNKDRIMGQMTVWMDSVRQQISNSFYEFGAILPQVAVSGTLTRRAVERTWLTASNAYVDRVGSELKGMIQVPPGYHFVGADVDSQELWIASILGDAHFGFHGSTALGWMTLQGTKSGGTDMHSKTAALVKISRDQAKVLNYGRIYGAGLTFAERLLQQFNHELSPLEAKEKAKNIYKMTKGDRKYLLNEEGKRLAESVPNFSSSRDLDKPFTKEDIKYLMKCLHYPPVNFMEYVDKLAWDGGTESEMFNRLEEIAQMECPVTPILQCCISRSLVPSMVQNDFMTSRINWVVQSSAVDYLHLMLTCMRWLIEKYDINARFSISVHDEIRYIVKSEDKYRAALALQITNLFTRAMCSYQLGMKDLPQSVAFFSCVDIDKVFRKEVTQDCVTPSNKGGLSKGYNVGEGEALDIFKTLEITKGSLGKVKQSMVS